MKKFKKIMALVMAMVMVLAMSVTVFAGDTPAGNDTPADGGATTLAEKSITIDGLAAGDNVKYYKVIEWKADGSGWDFVAPFKTALTADQQKEVIGYVSGNTVVKGKITDTTATAMAGAASSASPIVADGDTLASGATSWTKTDQAPGLYMALITGAAPAAGKDMIVYNPVFVAVQSDNAGGQVTLPLNYDDNGTAKKSTVTVDKKAKGPNDTDFAESTTQNVGDIIDFKVDTTVPAYLDSWTNPVFTVTDTLSSGLTRKLGEGDDLSTITVKAGETTLEVGADKDYEITANTAGGYKIEFTSTYLKKNTAATVVTITYQAKITTDAANVNPETNTVEIEYSKNPTSASDHGTKQDKTTHYTFDIDAGLQGDTNYTTSEIIKVGVDAAGNPVTEEKTYSNTTKHNPLQGAEFKIYKDAACTTPYTNSTITTDTVFTSSDMGLLNIRGLDEGTYYLKETKAATGYMLLTDKLKFVITATYKDVAATDTCNAYKELDTYSVEVYLVSASGTETKQGTSSYTFNNGTITKTDGVAGDVSTEVKNTQGTSLPSTGGMGTTILYLIGTILVLGAGILLVTRRRMSAQ